MLVFAVQSSLKKFTLKKFCWKKSKLVGSANLGQGVLNAPNSGVAQPEC